VVDKTTNANSAAIRQVIDHEKKFCLSTVCSFDFECFSAYRGGDQ